jgi:hypothetical protein
MLRASKTGVWLVSTLCAFLAVEGLVFRSGWYNRFLEPDSSTGSVELQMYWLNRFRPHGLAETLVVGDSRIAEGFSSQDANKLPSVKGKRAFWSAGMAGTSPRVWYYMIRDADPTRRRFENIVLAIGNYADQDQYDSQADRIIDLNFAIGRLRLTDVWDFASSFKTPQFRREAIFGGLLKGTVFRQDLQALFQGIDRRVSRANATREYGLDWYNGYDGLNHSVAGLTADWEKRTLHLPPGLNESLRSSIMGSLMPTLPPQTGDTTRYRMRWLGRIVDLYRHSPTRVVFVQLPRAPLPQPPSRQPATFIEWARRQPNVAVIEAATFQYLESPEFFADGLHLNRAGRTAFSTAFAERMSGIVARK